jgi:hypothetical protein
VKTNKIPFVFNSASENLNETKQIQSKETVEGWGAQNLRNDINSNKEKRGQYLSKRYKTTLRDRQMQIRHSKKITWVAQTRIGECE